MLRTRTYSTGFVLQHASPLGIAAGSILFGLTEIPLSTLIALYGTSRTLDAIKELKAEQQKTPAIITPPVIETEIVTPVAEPEIVTPPPSSLPGLMIPLTIIALLGAVVVFSR